MSFDIHYYTCNLGTRREAQKNPLTGEVQSVPVDDGLSDSERAAVIGLLRSGGAAEPDEFGCYALELPDGGSAEVYAGDLRGPDRCDGLMVALWSLAPGLVSFLWELCRAGNMVAMPVMEDEVAAVAGEAQRERVRARWPGVVVVRSPEEFGRLLGGGFAAWRAYRDRVVGE
jgi:hypothetical protein